MAEPITIYKLAILYLLDKSDIPLTNTQLSNFFLEKDYTDYFSIQEVLMDLEDNGLVRTESTHRNTQYSITEDGKKTLRFFHKKITDGMKEDVRNFLSENKIAFRRENHLLANYEKTENQEYAVRCQLRNENKNLIDLTLLVQKKEQAIAVCENWKKQNEEVYAYLMDIMLK